MSKTAAACFLVFAAGLGARPAAKLETDLADISSVLDRRTRSAGTT